MISEKRTSAFFYLGTLLSSVGNMTLSVALIAFMLKSGFSLLEAGFVIGSSRLIPVLISIFVGHKLDAYSPRKVLLWTEVLASLASVFLFLGWQVLDTNFYVILVSMLLRSLFTSAQTGSKGQIAKTLSSVSYQSNSKNAIWLNKVTQGATLFGGILSWVAIQYFDFWSVIIFDALTFIVNGIILFLLPVGQEGTRQAASQESPFKKFSDFYKFNGWTALLDAFLVFSMMGTSSFTARLAGKDQAWISIFVVSYGLAVWLAGFIERNSFIQKQRLSIWFTLAITIALLGTFEAPNALMWGICFVRDISFWILFHRISAHVQTDTPKELMSSVTFARSAQVISIFAIGDILVGLWKEVLPLNLECILRAIICLIAIVLILAKGKDGNHEKARL